MCAPMLVLYIDALVNRYFILSFSVPFWSTFSLKKPFFFPLQLSWFGTLFILTVFLTILRAEVHASPRSLLNYFFFLPSNEIGNYRFMHVCGYNWFLERCCFYQLMHCAFTSHFVCPNVLTMRLLDRWFLKYLVQLLYLHITTQFWSEELIISCPQ